MQSNQLSLTNDTAAFAAGELCRVGGLRLTRQALDLCAFSPAARLADIGCGKGATVRYLRSLGFAACGLDLDGAAITQAGPYCQTGDALALPYATASLDGLLYECSLSRMMAPLALAEARRVMLPGGKLVISDLYARNERHQSGWPLCSRSHWLKIICEAGFACLLFEDKSAYLKELTAQLLWQYGGASLQDLYGCAYDKTALKAARCGYFLLIAQNEGV